MVGGPFLAAVLFAAAAAIRAGFLQILGAEVIWITFYPAVALAALLGGLSAGVLTTLFAIAFAFPWIGPLDRSAGSSTMGVFLVNGLMISGISEAMNRSREWERERTEELSVANENLRRATEEAERASRAKSLFVANMAHELRTPLGAILGYSQLMQRDASLSHEHLKTLAIINRSGDYLLSPINDILDLARIEAGRVALEPAPFDLPALCRDLETMFRVRARARRLHLEWTGVSALPRCVVADETRLRAVLVNLVGNAIKYTERGGVAVRVRAKRAASGPIRLGVEVEDTGVGISESEIDRVFDRFEQAEAGRRSRSGTGLGLAISQEFVRTMGGRISVSSRPGRGSVFGFEVEVAEGREEDLPTRPAHRRVICLAPGQPRPRVLVAEDNEDARTLLMKVLKLVGFNVRGAANGQEAVAVFQEWRPQFVWMDIRMPVMDGLEATRVVKAAPGGADTRVAALTAHSLDEEREAILAAGCDDFVRKPFREQEIFEVMARHLGARSVCEGGEVEEAAIPARVAASRACRPGCAAGSRPPCWHWTPTRPWRSSTRSPRRTPRWGRSCKPWPGRSISTGC